ncbi:hypothetical protein Taro_027566 [Colocasia esculenta]|uniref:Uncharacterized protein n=1 Tax=Colocasia esculenta TaxID=4460 RepID=A0A843VP48_COLES|nr:hypothetical protein [Colocasia esculenta]
MCLRGEQYKPEAWEIISRSILHKYSGPLDVWLSICSSLCDHQGQTCCLINSYPYKSYLAMAEHESQWV